jgi:hypothetical protein
MTQEINSAQDNHEVTEASSENTQAEIISLTKKELDDLMAKTKTATARKYEKKFEQLGDIDELLSLRESAKKQQEELALKRGEFDKILQEKLSIKDNEIAKRDSVIKEYKINTPLLEAAAKHRAINAEQVKALLSNNVRLNDSGEVEVIDNTGAVKYKDNGQQYSVDELVGEFLRNNAHFVSPTPATTHTNSNISNVKSNKIDITKLDMKNPKDRELYKQIRKETGIA